MVVLPSHVHAQALYEDGYYKDLQGDKHKGLISINSVTDDQPYLLFKIKYRANPDTVFFRDISEIKVSGFKFSRQNVTTLAEGTTIKDSVFTEKSLLLRVEVEGKATLYNTQDGKHYTFYYSTPVTKLKSSFIHNM